MLGLINDISAVWLSFPGPFQIDRGGAAEMGPLHERLSELARAMKLKQQAEPAPIGAKIESHPQKA